MFDSGGSIPFYGTKLCPAQKRSKRFNNAAHLVVPSSPLLSPRLFLLRLFGTPGTELSTLVNGMMKLASILLMKQLHQLLLLMASWT